jgi:predicted nucleic-acid-binding protein
MISVDTNVVVRLLVSDDQEQFTRAKELFSKEKIFITTTVVLECEWVLRYAYHFRPKEIVEAFQNLFGLSNVTLEEPHLIQEVLEWHMRGLDFADAIHLAKSRDCDAFMTFDKKLVNAAAKIVRLSVVEP